MALFFPLIYTSERGETSGERAFAEHALRSSQNLLSNPVEALLTRRYVVRTITSAQPRPSNSDCSSELRPYQAHVTAVTFFGVPLVQMVVRCDTAERVHLER